MFWGSRQRDARDHHLVHSTETQGIAIWSTGVRQQESPEGSWWFMEVLYLYICCTHTHTHTRKRRTADDDDDHNDNPCVWIWLGQMFRLKTRMLTQAMCKNNVFIQSTLWNISGRNTWGPHYLCFFGWVGSCQKHGRDAILTARRLQYGCLVAIAVAARSPPTSQTDAKCCKYDFGQHVGSSIFVQRERNDGKLMNIPETQCRPGALCNRHWQHVKDHRSEHMSAYPRAELDIASATPHRGCHPP